MKYAIFFSMLFACVPLAWAASASRSLRRVLLGAMPLGMMLWNPTSINFFSHESYRGTARGMEVSLVYLIAFTLLLARLLSGRLRLRFPGMWSYGAYFAASLCSCFVATCDGLLAWMEIWKMLMMAMVFLTVANEVRETGEVMPLLWGLAAVIWASFATAVWQRYGCGVYQVRGVFPHQNSLSMFMTMTAPILLAGWFNLRSPREAWFMGSTFGAACVCTMMALSRGALICLPIASILILPTLPIGGWSAHKSLVSAMMLLGTIIGLSLFLPRVIERFETAPEASGKTRVELAQIALRMTRRHPMGVGLNNWGLRINDDENQALRTHSRPEGARDAIVETIYLLVGAECGYAGLATLLLWLAGALLLSVRTAIAYAHTDYAFLPAGCAAGLVAVYLQSTLEWVLKQAINFAALMMLLGVVSALWTLRGSIARTGAS